MSNYTKEIMDLLKENFEKVVGKKNFQGGSEARSYYLCALADNLFTSMDERALLSYGQGSGNEIFSGKMNALRSSSALTYNLFGNNPAKIIKYTEENKKVKLGKGVYGVEFEKQYHTLRRSVSGKPANLDAFLYCEETSEAIACEMKMMEWIFNEPGMLKKTYLNPENYEKDSGQVFVDIAKKLIKDECRDTDMEKYPCKMQRYDAFQMFKHTVACYRACVAEESREIKKLTLLNCVWELPTPDDLTTKSRKKYLEQKTLEHEEFDEFKETMKPAVDLFKKEKVDFAIEFYPFKDFLALLDKTEKELNYLKRYTFK